MNKKTTAKITAFVAIVLTISLVIGVIIWQNWKPSSHENSYNKIRMTYEKEITDTIAKVKGKKNLSPVTDKTIALKQESEKFKIVSLNYKSGSRPTIADTQGVVGGNPKNFIVANGLSIFRDSQKSIVNFKTKTDVGQLKWQLNTEQPSTQDSISFPFNLSAAYPVSIPTESNQNETSGGLYFYTVENDKEKGTFRYDLNNKEKTKVSDNICSWLTFNDKAILCLSENALSVEDRSLRQLGKFNQCVEVKDFIYCVKDNSELYRIELKSLEKIERVFKVSEEQSLQRVTYTHRGEVILQISFKGKEGVVNYEFKDGRVLERSEFSNLIVLN